MKFITLCFTLILCYTIQAQEPTFNPFFFGNKPATAKVSAANLQSIGRYHYDEKWNAGNIYLKNGDSLVAYYMRYDVIKNHLEVIFDNNIKAINGSFIKSFEWFSVDRLRPEKFISINSFSFSPSKQVRGFILLLRDGDAKLLKYKRMIEPRKSTSLSLLKDYEEGIQSLEEYYLVLDEQALEISGGRKKSLKIFDSKELDSYISNSNLKFNNENDLIEIVEYYNSLNKP